MHLRALPLLLLACSLLVVNSAPAVGAVEGQEPGRRIVAIGDVHGAYDALVEVLGAANLVDDGLAWSGGDSVLVQTGDLLDGGSGVRAVLDLMMRLQSEARAAGGDVIVLLGDHEVLNLLGELRDVSAETMATFASEDQTSTLREAFKEYADAYFASDRAWARATRPKKDDIRDEWIEDQVPGRVEYLRAMGPDGAYGEWLRTLPVVATLDGILFMHAGITPQLAGWSVDDINQRLADEIDALDAYRAYMLGERRSRPSPTWGRRFAASAWTPAGWIGSRRRASSSTSHPSYRPASCGEWKRRSVPSHCCASTAGSRWRRAARSGFGASPNRRTGCSRLNCPGCSKRRALGQWYRGTPRPKTVPFVLEPGAGCS